MAILSVTHVIDDLNQGFLPALLPFLIAQRDLSYTAAAGLVLAVTVSSSVVQPLIGFLADRRPMPELIAVGVFLAGAGMAFTGVAPTYPLIALAAVISGIGIAAFHPEAARFANHVAGEEKASGMRWFGLGGNLGFALGPLLAIPVLLAFGTPGTLVLLLPATVIAFIVWCELPRLRKFVPPVRKRRAGRGGEDRWGPFAQLTTAIAVRSMGNLGLVAFIPLYFIAALHASKTQGNLALALFVSAGALGTMVGGRWADRIGRRPVLVGSTLAAAVLLTAATWLGSTSGSVWIAALSMAVVGFVLYSSQIATVVLGQEYLPNHIGMASGVTFGLAISFGGVASPFLGWIADHHGLVATMYAVVGFLVAAGFIGLTLPRMSHRTAIETSSSEPQAASA